MIRSIYILTINGIPHYVGKTKNPNERFCKHKRKYPNSILEVIDEVPITEWKFWERHYISLYRSWGFKLDNKKLYAGNGSDVMSEEHKSKISKALKNIPKSKEHNLKVSLSLKGHKHSIKTKNKLSQTHIGIFLGKNNPAAIKINIYNDKNILMFTCNGNFDTICKNNNLPTKALRRSYYNNGTQIYTGKTIKKEILIVNKKFINWYAIKL